MVNTKDASMKYAGQRGWAGLFSASIVGMLLAAPAFAETDAERMKELERKLEAVQKEVSQMATGMSTRSSGGDGVPLHGFADVGFASNSQGDTTVNPKGFNVGSFDLYLTPQFGDNVKALVELIFEVPRNGQVATDLERVQAGYTFSDKATVWAGRFHTPYGFWNTGFHHGAQIQTSVLRPRFLDFEDKGGILPAHMVGLWGTGKVKAGDGKLTYDGYLGNGPAIKAADRVLDPGVAGDNNHQAFVGLNVGYEFSGNLDGLRVAGHWFQGDVDDDAVNAAGRNNKTGVNMVGGSAVYLENDWEVLSEYYRFSDKDKSGVGAQNTGTRKSWAGYVQVGKNLNGLTPYVRLERAVLSQRDNYFNTQNSGQAYARQSLGLKYDLNQKAALKLEVLNSRFEADTAGITARTARSYSSLFAQYAIRF